MAPPHFLFSFSLLPERGCPVTNQPSPSATMPSIPVAMSFQTVSLWNCYFHQSISSQQQEKKPVHSACSPSYSCFAELPSSRWRLASCHWPFIFLRTYQPTQYFSDSLWSGVLKRLILYPKMDCKNDVRCWQAHHRSAPVDGSLFLFLSILPQSMRVWVWWYKMPATKHGWASCYMLHGSKPRQVYIPIVLVLGCCNR